MSTKKWSDVRGKHVAAAGPEVVAEHAGRMIARVRAHSLAEVRRRKGLTQRQVADVMGVSTGRVPLMRVAKFPGYDPEHGAFLAEHGGVCGPSAKSRPSHPVKIRRVANVTKPSHRKHTCS